MALFSQLAPEKEKNKMRNACYIFMITRKFSNNKTRSSYKDMKLCTGLVVGGLGWYWVTARGVVVRIYIYFFVS